MQSRILYYILLSGFLFPLATASGQKTSLRTVERTTQSEVLVAEFDWEMSLPALLDSLGEGALSSNDLLTIAGGDLDLSTRVQLESHTKPFVRKRSSQFDEIPLPVTSLDESAILLLGELPENNLASVGTFRKKPVAVISAPVIEYDFNRQVLRRYSHVELEVPLGTLGKKTSGISQNPHVQVQNSVLANGTIFKLEIRESGVYRVDRQLLSELGLNPDSIDPDRVQVFGNGGMPVPALNSAPRFADLVEKPVVVTGGGDGSFGSSDRVVFYAQGTAGWRYDEATEAWNHYLHPFSSTSYVFVKIGTTNSKRLATAPPDVVVSPTSLSQVTGRYARDHDVFMWSREHGSGYTWVSNPISENGNLEVINEPGLPGMANGTATFVVRTAISSNPRATVTFDLNGAAIGSVRAPFSTVANSSQPTAAASENSLEGNVSSGQNPILLTMSLAEQTNSPQAALDWVRMFYPKNLVATEGYLAFHSGDAAGDATFTLSGFATQPVVLDVTEADSIFAVPANNSGGSYIVDIAQNASSPRELVAFTSEAVRRLDSETAVQVVNQNLHAIAVFPDLVIVTPSAFRDSANRLADRRRSEGLVVDVVDVDQVYNEFSGGLQDMRAVRDYVRFLYDRAENDDQLPRYLLLFGDGHFDFRSLRQLPEPENNWVLPYETAESFHPDRSYTSDDYFGLLDEEEGEWIYRGFNVGSTEIVDIGVGRIPVQTPEEAAMMVDKIAAYEDPATYGPWRSRYTLVADDAFTGQTGTIPEQDLHMQNVDSVAELIENELEPAINQTKIYAESYNRVFLNEYRIPDAKAELLKALEDGTLFFNYSGHGGPAGLAQEDLFTIQDAAALGNKDKLSIFVTATCSFGWWDIDDATSAAEALLLNPDGGAIALLTTVRQVYTAGDTTTLNAGLNRALNRELFRRDENGLPTRLGDAMVQTKGTRVGLIGNSRKFSLLGDPSMRVGLPRGSARIEQVNGVEVDSLTGQLKALDRVQLSGSIVNASGVVDTGFNGTVNITVFDAERRIPVKYRRYMPTPDYGVRQDLIWRGDVVATNGTYNATFVVPKDISYSNLAGRISVYAYGTSDAFGQTENVVVGGTSDNPPDDNVGPVVDLFLNDTTFVSGGLTPSNPELIVKVYDDSGINTVGAGVGHELLLTIDGDAGSSVDISSGFQSDPGSYQKGTVTWQLTDLEDGPGDLSVRVWDVLNNSTEAELEYSVAASERLAIRNVYNYPNPMHSETRFVFEHNQLPGTAAEVLIRVYTLDGRPVRTISTDEALPEGILTGGPVSVAWDGRDEDFDALATGIYLYKVRLAVDSPDGGRQVAEQIEKIALIR